MFSGLRPFQWYLFYLDIGGGGGGGGGGLTQKCRTCMGLGEGCFRDPKHKSNMYTFVQQRGCPYFIPNHKSINVTFVHTLHNKIIKNYEKMPTFIFFFNELLL